MLLGKRRDINQGNKMKVGDEIYTIDPLCDWHYSEMLNTLKIGVRKIVRIEEGSHYTNSGHFPIGWLNTLEDLKRKWVSKEDWINPLHFKEILLKMGEIK